MTTIYVVAVLGLSQVLVETTGGQTTRYVYGHDLLAEESTAWVWHLNDGLGSVRQWTGSNGKAEHLSQNITTTHQAWITGTAWAGYAGAAYVQAAPDLGALYATEEITASPELQYHVRFVTPGAYSLWLYGAAPDAAGDSVYVSLGGQVVGVSGFAPRQWTWANSRLTNGEAVTLTVAVPGLYTLHVWAREDGLRLDRILLTTDGNYVPTDQGPLPRARGAMRKVKTHGSR